MMESNTLKAVKEDFYEEHKKRHEEAQTRLLEGYTGYQLSVLSEKPGLKRCFFGVSLMMLFLPPLFLVAIYRSVYFGYISSDSFTAITSIAGGMVALVADIMFLPKIIAEYCFNKEEDKYILQLFSHAHQSDKDHDDYKKQSHEVMSKLLKK